MAILFHGSKQLFEKFDLSHALEGDGKCKFGYGVYITDRFETGAHYAPGNEKVINPDTTYYVYTVEVPDLVDGNHFHCTLPVPESVLKKVEVVFGEKIPDEAASCGKCMRKYIGNRLVGVEGSVKALCAKAGFEAEKAAAQLLIKAGVEAMIWPVDWKKMDALQNWVVFNDASIKIQRVDEIHLDSKKKILK